MKDFLGRYFKIQVISVLYSIITISLIRISIPLDFQLMIGLIFIQVVMIGIISGLVNYKLLIIKWLDVGLVIISYGIYCLLALALVGIIIPIIDLEEDYGRGIILSLGLISSWLSVIIGSILSSAIYRCKKIDNDKSL